MEDIFSQFGDIFGGQFGGGGRGGRRVNKGSNLRVKVKLTLEEIGAGVEKKIKVSKYISCDTCNGSGAHSGSSFHTCSTCRGSGHVTRIQNTILGQMQTSGTCPSCGGEGQTITEKCKSCHGDGIVRGDDIITLNIPAGVADGMQLSVNGKGNAGPRGGIPGDLILQVEEAEHDVLVRDGDNLVYNLFINFADAVLGTSVEVPTLDSKVKVKIDSGTQAGKLLRLKGKGLPSIEHHGQGDLIINIWTPQHLNSDEKKIMEKFREADNFQPKPGKKDRGFFDRMKEYFE
jgi:molecular chaperone DnaJ